MMFKLIIAITLIFSLNCSFAHDPYIRYSKDVNPMDILKIEPRLLSIMATISEFCKQNNITFIITSIIRDEKRNREVGGVSKTHVEGRAFDFSIRSKWGWDDKLLDRMVKLVEDKHGDYGMYGVNRRQKIVVIHDVGSGRHAHVQVVKDYPHEMILLDNMMNLVKGNL